MSDDLYHQQILDHYRHPQNFGKLPHADHIITETNASCGDSFTFYLKLNKPLPLEKGELEGVVIKGISFTGTGCAISTAASSLLTQHLQGKSVEEINNIDQTFMQHLIGVKVTPARLKCLMLPAKALESLKR